MNAWLAFALAKRWRLAGEHRGWAAILFLRVRGVCLRTGDVAVGAIRPSRGDIRGRGAVVRDRLPADGCSGMVGARARGVLRLAVGSKESGYAFPLFLIPTVWSFRAKTNRRRVVELFVGVGIVTLAMLALRWYAVGGLGGYAPSAGSSVHLSFTTTTVQSILREVVSRIVAAGGEPGGTDSNAGAGRCEPHGGAAGDRGVYRSLDDPATAHGSDIRDSGRCSGGDAGELARCDGTAYALHLHVGDVRDDADERRLLNWPASNVHAACICRPEPLAATHNVEVRIARLTLPPMRWLRRSQRTWALLARLEFSTCRMSSTAPCSGSSVKYKFEARRPVVPIRFIDTRNTAERCGDALCYQWQPETRDIRRVSPWFMHPPHPQQEPPKMPIPVWQSGRHRIRQRRRRKTTVSVNLAIALASQTASCALGMITVRMCR